MSVSLQDTDFLPVGGFDESFFGYNLVCRLICGHTTPGAKYAADKANQAPTLTLLHPCGIGAMTAVQEAIERRNSLVVPAKP